MHRSKLIQITFTAFFAAVAAMFPQLTACAADASERSDGSSALTVVIPVLLFAAALIISTVLTYKSRMKRFRSRQQENDDDSP